MNGIRVHRIVIYERYPTYYGFPLATDYTQGALRYYIFLSVVPFFPAHKRLGSYKRVAITHTLIAVP